MGRRYTLIAAVLAAVVLGTLLWPQDHAPPKPNILLIMLDDLGYNDLGANGNPQAQTQALDAFASEGIRYTRHYAEPSCSVARVAMLTGTYPSKFGFRPARLGLSPDTATVASVLQEAGYHTRHIGKWHVGNATVEQSPGRLGFEEWFGFLFQSELSGPSEKPQEYERPTYYNPWLRRNNSEPRQYEGHLTDILTQEAIVFLESREPDVEPWFLNLWFYAPHTPWEPARRFRHLFPEGKVGDFLALVKQVDTSIARVLEALDRTGMADNTLVVIVSDNGGTNRAVDNNAPFVGHKAQFSEGAIRTPLLLRWPGQIEAGEVSNELVSLYDLFPTLATAAGAQVPAHIIGRDLLSEELPPPPQLIREAGGGTRVAYSVLSRDGRWRLVRGVWASSLFDLESDPTGSKNVIADHPDIAAGLTEDFLRWREPIRLVDVSYEPLSAKGHAILRGDDVQRSPGYSGFTFIIGAAPALNTKLGSQTIAQQHGRWRLRHDIEHGLALDVLGITLAAPPLPSDACSEIVVSTYFKLSPLPLRSKKNVAHINLFVDGTLVAQTAVRHPPWQTWGLANPTYVGISAAGDEKFAGELTRPVIVNEYIVPDAKGEKIGNGISGVPSTCTRPTTG